MVVTILLIFRIHYLKKFTLYGNSVFYYMPLVGVTILTISIISLLFQRRNERIKSKTNTVFFAYNEIITSTASDFALTKIKSLTMALNLKIIIIVSKN